MAGFSGKLKNTLETLIDRMAADPAPYVRDPSADFTRNRKIAFGTLIRLLLSMGGNSLNKELYDYYKPTAIETPSASAFVQQRAKLKPEALERLFRSFNATYSFGRLCKGYRLLAVDSSVMSYKGDKSDDTYMPKSCGLNQFQLHVLYDILNKQFVDALVESRAEMNEPKAAWRMTERTLKEEKRIIIGDRGYGGLNFIEHMRRIPNAEYLIRIKDALWKELDGIPMADIDTHITFDLRAAGTERDKKDIAAGKAKRVRRKQWKKGRCVSQWDFGDRQIMRIRIVRFQITDDTWETIATSLPKKLFPLADIKTLYRMRWDVESAFRELKYAIGVTNFHSRKREFILQEIFARLTMYNFCQRIILNVVWGGKSAGSRLRKWEYQANFTMGIHICRDFFRCRGSPGIERKLRRYILPIRPDRPDTRKYIKRKGAVFFLYRVA